MATSKNNRKKGKKRQAMHSKPIPERVAKAQEEQRQDEIKSVQRTQTISFIGLVLMVVGFVIALVANKVIGYPITFVGALIGVFTVAPDQKHRWISIIGYTVYCLMVVFLWISELAQG